jgi:hypothetical protein
MAQQTISGRVTNINGQPVIYANIYIEGSYDGAISDSSGFYSLTSESTINSILIGSYIGFSRFSAKLISASDTTINIILEELTNELNEVSITAGIFSASDKKKSATMTAFDIATTPSAMGDIYGAYATMPGSQFVGEQGMLFVRGGESYETKTFMDGMLVQSPYFAKVEHIPTRGRFSPLLFSETIFSTGGYSAEFGQALSSVVDLTTNGMETQNKNSIAIMSVGGSASASRKWENSSVALSGMYVNNYLQHKLFKQNIDWLSDPVIVDGSIMYRKKTGETGLLKVFASYNISRSHLMIDNFESGSRDEILLKNQNLYMNATFTDQLSEKWLIRSGVGFNYDKDDITYNANPIQIAEQSTQVKVVLTHLTSDNIKTRIGVDGRIENFEQVVFYDSAITIHLTDNRASLFTESELKLSRKFALRIGARTEYSSILDKFNLAPRVSAAYKTGKNSQVSLAYGKFSQKPGTEYLIMNSRLSEERASHYILNYQYKKLKRIFRIEGYVKQYDNLVKYKEQYSPAQGNFTNSGFGYANGIDIFWRDRETINGLDYSISYSFLDSKRDYKDYESYVVPDYASAHNLSFVCKYFVIPWHTFLGFTYSYGSGRPYNDKNSTLFMNGKTSSYNDISMNATYLTKIFRQEAVIHLNITNLLGFNNIYGYRFSNTPDEEGIYSSKTVIPFAKRQAVVVLLLSL